MDNVYNDLEQQIRWTEGFGQYVACPKTWYEPIKICWEEIQRLDPNITVAQIKSKFNGLRFYVDYFNQNDVNVNDLVDEAIRRAERQVYEIERLPVLKSVWEQCIKIYSDAGFTGYETLIMLPEFDQCNNKVLDLLEYFHVVENMHNHVKRKFTTLMLCEWSLGNVLNILRGTNVEVKHRMISHLVRQYRKTFPNE